MRFSESLKSNRDFKNVYNHRKSYANRYLVMYVSENGSDKNILGISVSKKVGNSVVRHRVSRLIRESYRLHEDLFRSGYDLVVVARVNAKDAKYAEIESALLHVSRLHKNICYDICKLSQFTHYSFILFSSASTTVSNTLIRA